jgi:N-acetylglucosamine transport system substrate-binding protein
MKKTKILLALLSAFCVSCTIASPTEESGSGAKTTLKVMVYAAGFGMNWIEDAIKIYNEDHPNVKVVADGDSLAFDSIKQKLEAGNCPYDVILVVSDNYSQFVAKGYLEDLSDLYETTISGTTTKVKDIIPQQIFEGKAVEGKPYSVPWQQNPASGLIYNVELFKKYNWTLPKTMDEFWALADKISTDTSGRVAPLTFGGADGNGYLSWNLCQWLCEYYGYDGMLDFLKLASPEAYNVQGEGRKKIYETLARLTRGKTTGGADISLKGSVGATAITAQTNFVNAKAAMIVCGNWFPTEMLPYTSITNFEAGYCPMPHINADKKSGDQKEDTSMIRFSTDGNMMAVPSTSKQKALAKDFLAYMYTTKSYSSFVSDNNGLLRPVVNLAADSSSFNDFSKASYDYFYAGGNAKTIYQVSQKALLERLKLGMFMAYRGEYFSTITSKSSYEDALSVADSCVSSEMASVNELWDSKNNTWYF